MARAEIHILGSKSGYTTLASSPGISDGERAELEVLVFGDATSSEARARLERHAVMTGRPLRSGRIAISRMLPGGTDDVGRPTVEIVTLVVGAADYALVSAGLGQLAASTREWNEARRLVRSGMDLDLPDGDHDARDAGVLRAYETWVAACRAGSVGLLDEDDQGWLLALVALLEPSDQRRCRWGVGLLSVSAPVDICTLSPGAGTVGARPVLRAAIEGSSLLPERDYLQWFVEQNGSLPRSDSLVATKVEQGSDSAPRASAGRAKALRAARPAGGAGRERSSRRMTVIAASSAVLSLGLFVALASAYLKRGERWAAAASVAAPVVDEAEDQTQLASAGVPAEPTGESAHDRMRQEAEAVLAAEAQEANKQQETEVTPSPSREPSTSSGTDPAPPASGPAPAPPPSEPSSKPPSAPPTPGPEEWQARLEACFNTFKELRVAQQLLTDPTVTISDNDVQELAGELSDLIKCVVGVDEREDQQLATSLQSLLIPILNRTRLKREAVEDQLRSGPGAGEIAESCRRLLDVCFPGAPKASNEGKTKKQEPSKSDRRAQLRKGLSEVIALLDSTPSCEEWRKLKSHRPAPADEGSHRQRLVKLEENILSGIEKAAEKLWLLQLETSAITSDGVHRSLRNGFEGKPSAESALWCELLGRLKDRVSCARFGLPEEYPAVDTQDGNPSQLERAWRDVKSELFDSESLRKLIEKCSS